VLDAILSLTYVHDTLACIRCKFADDLATMAVDNDTRQIEYILQESLDSMDQWSKKWDMTLNARKTKVMLFGNPHVKLSVSLMGTPIEQVSKKIKYLGVWLDEQLNFDDQTEYAASKATRAPLVIAGYYSMIPHLKYISFEQASFSQSCATALRALMTCSTSSLNAKTMKPSATI